MLYNVEHTLELTEYEHTMLIDSRCYISSRIRIRHTDTTVSQ